MHHVRVTDAGFAEAVQDFYRSQGIPSRRPEPRLAERFVDVERRSVPFSDGMLAAWRLGTGPAVLLVHGWEDNHSLWSPLIDALADRGRAVVTFDMPAHGFSDGEWGFDPQAGDAVLAVAGALGRIDALVAHSSGTPIAARSLLEGVPAERMVLIAPPLRDDNRWLRYADRMGVSREVALAAEAAYKEIQGPARAEFFLRTSLPTIDADVLIVHSIDDERMPFSDSEDVVTACPHGALLAVKGLTHRRTTRDPTVVAEMADFLTDGTRS